jgi:hypothetical protein
MGVNVAKTKAVAYTHLETLQIELAINDEYFFYPIFHEGSGGYIGLWA